MTTPMTEAQQKVFDAIRRSVVCLTVAEIAHRIGMPESSTRTRVKALIKRGDIVRAGSTMTNATTYREAVTR